MNWREGRADRSEGKRCKQWRVADGGTTKKQEGRREAKMSHSTAANPD